MKPNPYFGFSGEREISRTGVSPTADSSPQSGTPKKIERGLVNYQLITKPTRTPKCQPNALYPYATPQYPPAPESGAINAIKNGAMVAIPEWLIPAEPLSAHCAGHPNLI